MHSSHLVLFEQQRQAVQRQVKEVSAFCDVPPWRVFLLVVDLRSEFGRSIALHFAERLHIDRTIRAAEARGEIPGFAVPVGDESGLEIIRLFTPQLEAQVLQRPPLTVAMLLVDEHDRAVVGIGRLLDARLALS